MTTDPTQYTYPIAEFDTLVLGPECFTDKDATVICYKGQNYTLQPDKPADTDEFDMELSVTATSGVVIPMRLVVTYPEGHGFYAAKALAMVPDNMNGIWQELVRRGDASTVKVMLESPNNRGDDDE